MTAIERLRNMKHARLFRRIAEGALAHSDPHKRSRGDNHIRIKKLVEWFGDRAADSIRPREIEACWNRYRSLLSLTYRDFKFAAVERMATAFPGAQTDTNN